MKHGMKHGPQGRESRARRSLERAHDSDRVSVSGIAARRSGPSSRSLAISYAVGKYLSGYGWLVPKRGFVQAFPEWVSFVEDFLGTVET